MAQICELVGVPPGNLLAAAKVAQSKTILSWMILAALATTLPPDLRLGGIADIGLVLVNNQDRIDNHGRDLCVGALIDEHTVEVAIIGRADKRDVGIG